MQAETVFCPSFFIVRGYSSFGFFSFELCRLAALLHLGSELVVVMSIAVLPKSSSASPSTTVSLTGPPPTLPTPILTFLKWLELTTGRDKLLRLVQYSSKFIVQTLRDLHYSNDIIDRLTKGASSVGQTRKLIRFFRSLEFLNDFLKATAVTDEFERIAAMIRAFSFCMWMLMDHVQWLHKAGYIKLDNIKTVDTVHSQSWFYGLFVSAVICVYKLTALNTKREKLLKTITTAPNSGIATTSSSGTVATVDASPSASMAVLMRNVRSK